MILKIALVVVFFAVMVAVGITCRKRATDVNGFVLGGRSIGPWLTAFAYGTSYFSAVIFIGYSGQFGWKFGLASTWIGIGNAVIGSLLPWIILGSRTRKMTQYLDSNTMPDFFGKRYDSKALKLFAAALVFIFLIPYTASLYNGLSRLFEMAFHIDYTICIIVMAVLTCVYVVAGGYMATAVNDFIQGIIMLFGIVAVVFAVVSQAGGLSNAAESLNAIEAAGIAKGTLGSWFGPDIFNLVCVIILTSLGTWGLPQMAHKFYAIKDDKAIIKGTVISTIFALIVAGGCYFIGGFGRLFVNVAETGLPVGGYDNVVPTMLSGVGDILLAVVVVLVLSASMSTLSSLVLTSSSTLTLDFIKGTVVKNMDEKKQLSIMRILVLVFIAISAIIAILQVKVEGGLGFIADLMGVSWGALAGAFLAPYLYGLYNKNVTKASVAVNFTFAAGVMILNVLFRSSFPTWLQSPINCGAFVMLAGLIIVPLVSLFTKKPDQKLVDAAFESLQN